MSAEKPKSPGCCRWCCALLVAFFLWCCGQTFAQQRERSPSQTDSFVVAFTGDILLDRGVRQFIDSAGADRLFTPAVDSLFRRCHAVVANLECPVTRRRQRNFKRFIFRGEPEVLDVLHRHGITHLNLANNHTVDQGRQGLLDTRDHVRASGMTPLGAGANMDEAAQPVLLCRHPRPVYVLSTLRLSLENFSYLPHRPCVSQEPFDSLLARVGRLRAAAPDACIIVCLHWGEEHSLEANPIQRMEARRLVDVGADLLVGHHPHTLQPHEVYRGRHIFYSIGNFIFDLSAPHNRKAAVLKVAIGSTGLTVDSLQVDINNCVPCL